MSLEWWTHPCCIYNRHSPAARICTSYTILLFMRYFLHTNFYQLACTYKIWNVLKYMQTQRLCLVYVIYTLEYLKFRFTNLKHSGVILILCLILQKKSLEDGIYLFYQPHVHIFWERNLLFLRNMFEFLGHTQILEVCTASKGIMLFRHDNGFVLHVAIC
jgi:hypothetical protein